jgi:hypothetical protein
MVFSPKNRIQWTPLKMARIRNFVYTSLVLLVFSKVLFWFTWSYSTEAQKKFSYALYYFGIHIFPFGLSCYYLTEVKRNRLSKTHRYVAQYAVYATWFFMVYSMLCVYFKPITDNIKADCLAGMFAGITLAITFIFSSKK